MIRRLTPTTNGSSASGSARPHQRADLPARSLARRACPQRSCASPRQSAGLPDELPPWQIVRGAARPCARSPNITHGAPDRKPRGQSDPGGRLTNTGLLGDNRGSHSIRRLRRRPREQLTSMTTESIVAPARIVPIRVWTRLSAPRADCSARRAEAGRSTGCFRARCRRHDSRRIRC